MVLCPGQLPSSPLVKFQGILYQITCNLLEPILKADQTLQNFCRIAGLMDTILRTALLMPIYSYKSCRFAFYLHVLFRFLHIFG